tara:strand:+ start:42 stop:389 length:348 start_codon:yes stop_codon:yes gene_type:complete
MEINKCMVCVASCCSLEVEINQEDYLKMKALGLDHGAKKHSSDFIEKNPIYKGKELFFDELYKDNFARLKKGKDGFCLFLNRETRLCSIYENRPQVCKDFSNNSKHCEKIRKCIL